MSDARYLTKSRYILGLECPTKLFYTGKKDEYADQKFDDRFLQQLANGGFQVGELAKCYYSEGIPIDTLEYDEAVEKTDELLARENVTIFEAAFRHNNLFIRADILRKQGSSVDLIEVKAKSWPPSKSAGLVGVRGGINKDFRSKIADLAFQTYVIRKIHPEWDVHPYFLFTAKKSKCPTDGLHQKFRITKVGSRRKCIVDGEITREDLDPKILCLVPADQACEKFASEMDPYDGVRAFEQHIEFLADHYEQDRKVPPRFATVCHKCEFQTKPGDDPTLKSGRHECWKDAKGWTKEQIEQPNVLNIWYFLKKDKMIDGGKIRLADLTEIDIGITTDDEPGLTRSERQWKQVCMVRDGETAHWIDRTGLKAKIGKWKPPYHFIDFETCTPAVPFKKDRRPYEGIAFQFSHHVVEADGSVHHGGEWLESRPGVFPNYDFIRALRDELSADEGTILRYANHENTYLNHIWEQLDADESVADREDLCAFIESISHSKEGQMKEWCGERDMVDMYALVQRHYLHPECPSGSCSLKHILPAVLNSSEYLQTKYAMPLVSTNFPDGKVWVERDATGRVMDPYKLLDPMFRDASPKDLELLLSEEEDRGGIREGGAAMAAYLLLQLEAMSDYERAEIEASLKRYCELDTLAMVMIYEAWKAELG